MTSAARFLGVTAVTVRYWIRWGWINGYTIGPQTYRLRASDIRLLKRLAIQHETNVTEQFDTRYGSILRDSPDLFEAYRNS